MNEEAIKFRYYWEWTTFERGFDTPEALVEAHRANLSIPKCDLCRDFFEKIEIGRFICVWTDIYLEVPVHQERIDIEVRVECHSKRWSFNGHQAQQYLDSLLDKDHG